jgi:serine/threonine-protein kinase
VFEAEHLRLRQPIAIKFLNPQMLGVEEIVQRFEREARAAATLRSRHVVRVTDVEVTDGIPYMVMELLEGVDLESERERRERLPYEEVVDYILQVSSALAEAHAAGIVHRDLKPGNLFLAKEDAERSIVKVLDFGISKFMSGEDQKLTSAGAIMGTALYMSPEQIRGEVTIDARSDIWSLGVILYELISGNAPWVGPTTRVAAAIVSEPTPDLRATTDVPDGLAQAIHRMLEKVPANRFATITDVAHALAPFAPRGSVGAEIAEVLARRSQRNLLVDGAPVSGSLPSSKAAPGQPSPERSTMGPTTSAPHIKIAGPRALWGAFAGFVMLAVVGLVLMFAARAKPADQGPTRSGASAAPNRALPAYVPATPVSVASTNVAADPTPASPEATASAPPSPSAHQLPVAGNLRKPPPSVTLGDSHTVTMGDPHTVTREAPPRPSRSAAAPSDPAPVNPPFLK